MTTDSPTVVTQKQASGLSRLPFLNNLEIGRKLTIGFGILVLLALVIIGFSYLGSLGATQKINTTSDLRAPAVLISSEAQANLLRMLADVRGYLALGDPIYRENYSTNQAQFAAELDKLKKLAPFLNQQDQTRIKELETAFHKWSELPETLFALRDDQLDREPAYNLLATTGSELVGNILIDINQLIELQGQRQSTTENLQLLQDMAQFQGSFAAMFSGLRGYVTTRNRIFRIEYEGNLAVNQNNWERILNQQGRLTSTQQELLANIKFNRREFLTLPDEVFNLLESDEWRKDLYLFRTETVPLTDNMEELLEGLTSDQQNYLQADLEEGRDSLEQSNAQTLMVGIVSLIFGIVLAYIFRENIAGPVQRLTNVADRIRQGDLEAKADVESKDEIGTLAITFNNMTSKLRNTLFQVRKEKERADGLLDVVIPIGVQLSSEKNFNRLLETMLEEAKGFCQADSGTIYLRDKNQLRAVIIQNDSIGVKMGGTSGNEVTLPDLMLKDETGNPNNHSITAYTVLSGEAVNVPDRSRDERFQSTSSHVFNLKEKRYHGISYLSIPLKNNDNEVIGAMQLVNAQDSKTGEIIPFDDNLQQLMESYSSLAVAALAAYEREQRLRQEIKQLRIQIDETKREQAVQAIVDDEGFADIQAKAASMRRRRKRQRKSDDS